jgi:DNA-binding IclR family transcriptional regulator
MKSTTFASRFASPSKERPLGRKNLSIYLELIRAGDAGITIVDISRRTVIDVEVVQEHLRTLRRRGLVEQHRWNKWRTT